MSNVKRFDPPTGTLIPREVGQFVLYSDYLGLEKELEVIERRNRLLTRERDELAAKVKRLMGLFGEFENDPKDNRMGWSQSTLDVLRGCLARLEQVSKDDES